MRCKMIIAAILSVVLFTGCSGGEEVSGRAFAQLVGLNRSEGLYTVTLQIYKPESGSAETDTSLPNSAVISGGGVTVQAALSEAESKTGKRIFLGHVKAVVIGEGIENPAEELSMFLDGGVSPSCPVIYSGDPAAVAGTLFTDDAFSAERFTSILNAASSQGRTVCGTLAELSVNTSVLDCAAALPVAKAEGETILFEGLTFARKNGIAGNISPEDTVGAKLLLDKFEKGDKITVPVTAEGKRASVLITGAVTRLSAEISDGSLKVGANIRLDMTVTENPYGADEEAVKKAARENIRDSCVSAYSSAVWYNSCDIYGIKKLVRRDCPEAYEEYCSGPESWLADSSLTVTVY